MPTDLKYQTRLQSRISSCLNGFDSLCKSVQTDIFLCCSLFSTLISNLSPNLFYVSVLPWWWQLLLIQRGLPVLFFGFYFFFQLVNEEVTKDRSNSDLCRTPAGTSPHLDKLLFITLPGLWFFTLFLKHTSSLMSKIIWMENQSELSGDAGSNIFLKLKYSFILQLDEGLEDVD